MVRGRKGGIGSRRKRRGSMLLPFHLHQFLERKTVNISLPIHIGRREEGRRYGNVFLKA